MKTYYHITPDAASISKEGIDPGDGTSGVGVYLTDSLHEALKWQVVLEYEKSFRNTDWSIIEVTGLDEAKLDKEEIFEDNELFFTEYVYRAHIGLNNIKSIIKI